MRFKRVSFQNGVVTRFWYLMRLERIKSGLKQKIRITIQYTWTKYLKKWPMIGMKGN